MIKGSSFLRGREVMDGYDASSCDPCASAMEQYQSDVQSFGIAVGDFVDGGPTTLGEVVESGIDAYGSGQSMDAACDGE